MALTRDPLFAGITRPTLVGGVTYEAFILNLMVCGVIFLASGSVLYLLFAVPIHGICYLICAKEPRFFQLIYLWSITKGRNINRRFWGASSYSATESYQVRKIKEKRTIARHQNPF